MSQVSAAPNEQTTPKIAPRYLITTENPQYTGKVFGVRIERGRGLLDPAAIDPILRHSYEEVVHELQNNMPGYTLTPITTQADLLAAIGMADARLPEAVEEERLHQESLKTREQKKASRESSPSHPQMA